LVGDAMVTLSSSFVTRTQPLAFEELFGDAVVVASLSHAATLSLSSSRFEHSDRAGIASFSAAVDLRDTRFSCNALHIDGEQTPFGDFSYADGGGNACGCDGVIESCKATSANLAPPSPL
jgi:hypothetical protein